MFSTMDIILENRKLGKLFLKEHTQNTHPTQKKKQVFCGSIYIIELSQFKNNPM